MTFGGELYAHRIRYRAGATRLEERQPERSICYAEGKDENKHALIRDGKPTWLLDVALAARRLMGS